MQSQQTQFEFESLIILILLTKADLIRIINVGLWYKTFLILVFDITGQ